MGARNGYVQPATVIVHGVVNFTHVQHMLHMPPRRGHSRSPLATRFEFPGVHLTYFFDIKGHI